MILRVTGRAFTRFRVQARDGYVDVMESVISSGLSLNYLALSSQVCYRLPCVLFACLRGTLSIIGAWPRGGTCSLLLNAALVLNDRGQSGHSFCHLQDQLYTWSAANEMCHVAAMSATPVQYMLFPGFWLSQVCAGPAVPAAFYQPC